MIQILVSGNAVIVIAHAKFAIYCDVFPTLDIPRGVVNFLSNENISDLELSWCATDYVNYEKQLFTPNLEKNIYKPYSTQTNCTLSLSNNFINYI